MPAKKKGGTKRAGAKGRPKMARGLAKGGGKVDLSKTQKILVVAIGRGRTEPNVYHTPPARPIGKAIITGLGDGLVRLLSSATEKYKFQIDYVDGEPGTDTFRQAIGAYIDTYHPAVVVPIASNSTKAAQKVLGPTSAVPMVFVVVSDPADEKVHNRYYVTGFSTKLRHTIPDCLKYFTDILPSLKGGTVHALHQATMHPTKKAKLPLQMVANTVNVNLVFHELKGIQWKDIKAELDSIPKEPSKPPKVGLLMVPDDLVVSYGKEVINEMYGKHIPTFVQVVELVDKSSLGNSALAGYGIPGLNIGESAAVYVDQVIRGGSGSTRDLPVVELDGFAGWVNDSAISDFGVTTALPGWVKVHKP